MIEASPCQGSPYPSHPGNAMKVSSPHPFPIPSFPPTTEPTSYPIHATLDENIYPSTFHYVSHDGNNPNHFINHSWKNPPPFKSNHMFPKESIPPPITSHNLPYPHTGDTSSLPHFPTHSYIPDPPSPHITSPSTPVMSQESRSLPTSPRPTTDAESVFINFIRSSRNYCESDSKSYPPLHGRPLRRSISFDDRMMNGVSERSEKESARKTKRDKNDLISADSDASGDCIETQLKKRKENHNEV
eukprot:Sdes_comp14062_c0_seq1m3376